MINQTEKKLKSNLMLKIVHFRLSLYGFQSLRGRIFKRCPSSLLLMSKHLIKCTIFNRNLFSIINIHHILAKVSVQYTINIYYILDKASVQYTINIYYILAKVSIQYTINIYYILAKVSVQYTKNIYYILDKVSVQYTINICYILDKISVQ